MVNFSGYFGALAVLLAVLLAMVQAQTVSTGVGSSGQLQSFTIEYPAALAALPDAARIFLTQSGSNISLSGATITGAGSKQVTVASSGGFGVAGTYEVTLVNPIPAYCSAILSPTNVGSMANTTVGTGTAASCTEAAFRAAVAVGGLIVFNCGTKVVSIPFTQGTALAITKNTIIYGAGKVEIDAQFASRMFEINNSDPATLTPSLRLEGMRFTRGSSSSGSTTSVSSPASGSGGVVYLRGGTLELLDSDFVNNRGASTGQDVGGGAVYVFGGVVKVQGCMFVSNTASNAGALGTLGAVPTVVNSVFSNNHATGTGGNPGNGGNGGAVTMDGQGFSASFCGCQFANNDHNAFGTLFRVGYATNVSTTLTWCEFRNNKRLTSGSAGALYLQDHDLRIIESAIISTTVPSGAAAGQLVSGGSLTVPLQLNNVLVYGNTAQTSLASGFSLPSKATGTMTRCTFAQNSALFATITATNPTTALSVSGNIFNNVATNGFNPVNANNPAGTCTGANYQWPQTRSGGGSDTGNPICSAGTAVTFQNVTVPAPSDQGCPTLSSVVSSPASAGADCPTYGAKTVGRRNMYEAASDLPIQRGPIIYQLTVSGSTVTVTEVTGSFLQTSSGSASSTTSGGASSGASPASQLSSPLSLLL